MKFLIVIALLFSLIGCVQAPIQKTRISLNSANIDNYRQEQKAIFRKNSEDHEAAFNIARAYFYKQDYTNAENYVRQAVFLSPLNSEYLELLGNVTFYQNRYSEAIQEFNTALRLQSDRTSIHLRLALAYEQIEEYDLAFAALESLLQQDEQYTEAFFHLARMSFKQHEYENALQAIHEMLLLEPTNRDGRLLKLRTYIAQGNYYHAQLLIDEFLQENPNWYDIKREQLKVWFLQKKDNLALQGIKSLASKGQLIADSQMLYAMILMRKQQPKAARQVLTNVLQTEPQNIAAIIGMIRLEIQIENYEQALNWTHRGLSINRNIAQLHFLKASLLFQRQDFLQGDLALNQAVALDQFSLPIQLLNLNRQLMQGRLKIVEDQLTQLRQQFPLNIAIIRLQADLYAIRQQYEKAEKLLIQARVVKDSPLLQFGLARILYLQGKYKKTLTLTKSFILQSNPSWTSIYLHTLALTRLEKIQEAFNFIQPYLDKKEAQGFAHRLLAHLYRYNQKEEEAQAILRRGLEKFPSQIYLLESLSSSYIATAKWDQARILLENSLRTKTIFHTLFLDRLIFVYYQLGKPESAQKNLQILHSQNDPISLQYRPLEAQFMFPVPLSTDYLLLPVN